MNRDRAVVILLGMALFLAVPAAAQAAVTVNTNGDPAGPGCTGGTCSLRQAIAAANPGDTITFAPSLTGQTITLSGGVLSITQSVTIAGPGAGNLTVSGNHTTTVFDVAPSVINQDVTISGLTIANGSATTNGGGILAAGLLRSLTLSGDTITGNQVTLSPTSSGGGAGVYVNGGGLIVSGSTITSNTVTMSGSAGNSSGGAGLYDNGGDIQITGSDVSNNTVTQTASSGSSGGAGIYSNGGDITVSTSTIRNNTDTVNSSNGGSDGGGGIYSNGGQVGLQATSLDGNTFKLLATTSGFNGGGGLYSNGGDLTLISASVDANSLTVNDSSTAGFDGGGGIYSNGGQIGLTNSTISQNSGNVTAGGPSDGGGAIFDDGTHAVYLTSTLSENSMTISGTGAQGGGGAINSQGTNLISNATIAGNTTNMAGGGIFGATGVAMKNTIVADNTATPAGNCAGGGTFSSQGFNLESTNTCHLTASGDLVNTEPGLGPVQNNGGLTPTQALSSGSPAVDAGACTDLLGNPLTTDQRGISRPQPAGGKCDIGAYELVPSAPPPPSPPGAVPGTPTVTSSTGASFSGSVNPQGQVTTTFFQYGIDARFRPGSATGIVYDQSTPPQSLPADTTPHAVAASVSGLVPNALYHVRLVASNAIGTTFGPDQTFTTPADPAPPPPVLGQSVNVKPVSGKVFVLVGTQLVPLTEGQRIPSGAILDTRSGSLLLTAAAGKGHKHQTGVFGGAIFKLTQVRSGLTNLSLKEGALKGAPTFATCKAHKAGEAAAAAVSSKTLQLLHASAHGKFRTSGRYAAATVRGTKWTTADRCDGTRIHVGAGSVAVSDFVRHKTVILHAGQSYLARLLRRG